MKSLFYLIAFLSAIIFCLGIAQLIQHGGKAGTIRIIENDLKGFTETATVPGLEELKKAYVVKIREYNTRADDYHRTWLWLSFLVTALTAASALVSAIKAAKGSTGPSSTAMIVIAVLTFFGSLGSWGTTQLNEIRNGISTKSVSVVKSRNDFYNDYQKAKDDTERSASVDRYTRDLELL